MALAAHFADRLRSIKVWPFLPEIMTSTPEEILADSERRTRIKMIGMDCFNWNPATGLVAENPLPRPFEK